MATEYTMSVASGILTDVLWYAEGPKTVLEGHYSSPDATTGYIETGMYNVTDYYVQDADVTTFAFSAGSNGTYAVYFSGMVAGATGYISIKGY